MAIMIIGGCTAPDNATTTPGTTSPATFSTAPATAPGTTSATLPGTTTAEEEPVLSYEILKAVPEGMQPLVESMKEHRGYYYSEEEQILMIFMGMRPTGGYSLLLADIEAKEGTLHLVTSEKSPGPNDMVTQALTYPMLVLKLEHNYSDFDIQNTSNQSYDANPGHETR